MKLNSKAMIMEMDEYGKPKWKEKGSKEETPMNEYERYFKEEKYISDSNPLDTKSSMLTKLANYTGHRE